MTEQHTDATAQLLALAEAPEEEARRLLVPLLGDFEPLPQRPWTQFPVRSVAAVILLRAARHAEAFRLAAESLRINGQEDLASHVIHEIRKEFHNAAIRALEHKRPDQGRMFLNYIISTFGGFVDISPEWSLINLLEFVDVVAKPELPDVPARGRPTVISLGVWGERYIEAAERLFLPCCLAPGNVPELSAFGTVYLRIHTALADVARIRDLPVIKALATHACIDVRGLPQEVMGGTSLSGKSVWNRKMFAAYTYADVMFARRLNADIIIGGGDWMVANKCFSAAKRLLQSGYEAVVVQPIRAVAGEIDKIIEAAGCREGISLSIPADLLYRASLETMHPSIRDGFMRQSPTHISIDPIQFFFPTPNGFVLRGLQLSPLAASTSRVPADLGCDFHTYDTRLLSDLLIGTDRSKACFIHHNMPGDLIYMPVDDLESLASFGNFELSPQGAADSIGKWMGRDEDLDHFIWAVQQRFEYALPPGLKVDVPQDCRREEDAVNEIISVLESRRNTLVESLNPYRRRTGDTIAPATRESVAP